MNGRRRHGSILRRALILSPFAASLAGLHGLARAATLPSPASLQDAVAQSASRRQPLLVLASLEGCPYCRMVRDSHLAPLRAEENLPVVQLDLGSDRAVIDFEGRPTTHDALLRAWRVRVTPTVLFFGAGGKELTKRLVGASIPDFYGAYLSERLQDARSRLA